MEAWIFLHTIHYLFLCKPLANSFPLPAPPKQAFAGSMPRASRGLALALVQRSDILHPTLVPMRGRADLAGQVPARDHRGAAAAAGRVANFLTVDVECWFHAHNLDVAKTEWSRQPTRVVDNVRRILDLMRAQKAKATFFVLGWVADRYPEVVRMIDAEGHEIGTHGYIHDKVTDMTPYEFEKDLDKSLDALSRHTSRRIIGHRASNFSIVQSTLWALKILARYGIEYDSSIFPVRRDRYGIPDYPNQNPHVIHLPGDTSIREIPLSAVNLGPKAVPISGGGYLRLYPYAFTDLFIRARNKKGLPSMVYFHPWELDAGQQRIKAGLLKTFLHYVNLDTTEWKIRRLLEGFRFTSVEEGLRDPGMQKLLTENPVRIHADALGNVGKLRPADIREPALSPEPEVAGVLAA